MLNKVNGSLLVTTEGLETSCIIDAERDGVVSRFYEMKFEAEHKNDHFYVLESVYRHSFSFGRFYPEFVNMSWSEFRACETLKGISQTTFQMMQSFCKNPSFETLGSEDEFRERSEPHAQSGYINSNEAEDFVNNVKSWEDWHRRWYCCHQEQIDWQGAGSNWFPRMDLILMVLRRELIAELGQVIADTVADSDLVSVFYERVMRHKGCETEAYASKIGGEVCLCNYYVYEPELSKMEQDTARSTRRIYSIVNCQKKTQFISIDFVHGMFEFHNEHGDHLGEYRFDGSFNSCAVADHSLHNVKLWRKRSRE